MRLTVDGADINLYHSVKESFGDLLRATLNSRRIGVAHGPIYIEDPATSEMFPYMNADSESGWSGVGGVPDFALEKTRQKRQEFVDAWRHAFSTGWDENADFAVKKLDDWARAGLVLEICRRRGVNVRGLGKAHVDWKLNNTVTTRFGASPWGASSIWENGFNPLTIPRDLRHLIVPSAGHRKVVVLDYKAMDLSSMIKLVPGLKWRYGDHEDLHYRTAELVGVSRDVAKEQIFVYAYGGRSEYTPLFEDALPEFREIRRRPHGEFPRQVQSWSAKAFRAGLSQALPLLLDDDVIPMFTVHDELVLDVDDGYLDKSHEVMAMLELGATARIGVRYHVALHVGSDYGKAKED